MSYRLFISYSRADFPEEQIKNIVSELESPQLGVTAFTDVLSSKPGSPIREHIMNEIAACDTFILFWGKNSSKPDNVNIPIELGAALRDKDIIPMKLEKNSKLPLFIGDLEYIPVYNGLERALDKLKKHIFEKATNRSKDKTNKLILLGAVVILLLLLFNQE